MLARRIAVLALIAVAALAADTGRAEACSGSTFTCQRIEDSLVVTYPGFKYHPPDVIDVPTGPHVDAWDDALAADPLGVGLHAQTVCNTINGDSGGFAPGSSEEDAFLQDLLTYPPESARHGSGFGTDDTINLDSVYGATIFHARIWALRCRVEVLQDALEACITWAVHAGGVVHASPRTGVVNTRSLFWLDGVLAEDKKSWELGAEASALTPPQCDPANDGAACVWDPVTSPLTEGVWVRTGDFTYTETGVTHTVDCGNIGGLLDDTMPTGRATATTVLEQFVGVAGSPVNSGMRFNHGSDPPGFPRSTRTDGTWNHHW